MKQASNGALVPVPFGRRDALAALFLLCVSIGFAAPVLKNLHNWGIKDWDQHIFHHAVPRQTILEHHQLPLWNPYYQSGAPLLANPESRVLSPTFALTLLFGAVIALKLESVAFLWLGLLGTYVLLRHYGIGRIGSIGAALVSMLNSWYALHVTVGHVWAFNLGYLPWAFLFHLWALENPRHAITTGLVLALMLLGGGPYPMLMTLLLLAVHAGAVIALGHQPWMKTTRVLGAIVLLTVFFSAIKLLPALENLQTYPRTTEIASGYTGPALANALFNRTQDLLSVKAERVEEFNDTRMHEGMYVGLATVALALLGVWRSPRRLLELLLVLGFFTWLTLGDKVPFGPWNLVHLLPGYDSMRMVQRFGIVSVFALSILAGFGIQALGELARRATDRATVGSAASVLAVLLLLTDLTAVNSPILRHAFVIPPFEVDRSPRFQQILSRKPYDREGWNRDPRIYLKSNSSLYPAFLANLGATSGYIIVPIPSRAVPRTSPRYRGEVFLTGTAGNVDYRQWSPNRLRLWVEAESEGYAVVNQNHAAGWRARAISAEGVEARRVEPRGGLLAVRVTPSDRELELTYRPASFVVGAIVSTVSLLLVLAFWFRRPA